MGKHNETGIKGEQIAENFLQNKGYEILHRNWCYGKAEVDIIAGIEGLLLFVEVKTRNRMDFGFPEDAVGPRKQDMMKIAAEAYMADNPQYNRIQFDIISILIKANSVEEILHIEDAFY